MKLQKNILILVFIFSSILFSVFEPVFASDHAPTLKAISDNNFNELLKHKKKHPWIEDYIIKLLKTDLDFANGIENSKGKLELLETVLKKTTFVPTKIQILNQISALQKTLKLSDQKTQEEIKDLTSPVGSPKDCSGFIKKGKIFRDLRDFDQSLFHFQAAFDCYDPAEDKINALKELTLTQKVKFRGKDFLKASLDTYNFTKQSFAEKKISSQLLNKIGIDHVRTVWTYDSTKNALTYLAEIKDLLNSNYSLQTVYWIYARIYEEKKDIKKSQKYLNLALKEKPLVEEDIIAIYWQKFWNHYELNQFQEAEDALKASLAIGNPNEGQSRTYYWLVDILEEKLARIVAQNEKIKKKNESADLLEKTNSEITKLKSEIESYKSVLINKYPISFYTALINKISGHKYSPSDLENLDSEVYKSLPNNFDFKFYKDLHQTSTLATQSFLNKYYSQYKSRISKEQRFLIKRMLARNGETTELFVELESRPEVCNQPSSPCMDLFPKPYESSVINAAKKYNVPLELIYSIIRQESIFNPLAKSWADARGLMQLLPSLAKEISKKAEVEYKSPLDLYSVDKNIFFGTYLIKSLVAEMNNSLVLGLCGYNAEKSRAKVWFKTRYKNDWLKFIEEIPYQETRNYNKLVLRNFLIYSNNDEKILKPWFPKGILD